LTVRKRTERRISVKLVVVGLLMCCTVMVACRHKTAQPERRQLGWSGWIEETAAQRGYIKPGEIAQFGCPPGWLGVEDTAAALRGRQVSTVYVGTDPLPREGTITCVAQREFGLAQPEARNASDKQPIRQPLAPVWVEIGADSTTIGFRSELPLSAAIYIGRDTPCGPRVIGVRLGDLLKWLVDPQAATKRDFLGMVSAGCPGSDRP
jgi:hypothetical protein